MDLENCQKTAKNCGVKTNASNNRVVGRKSTKQWPVVRCVEHKNGTRAWLVDARINGRGERLFFKSRVEANTQAELLRTKRENEGKAGVQIPERLRVEAIEWDEKLKQVGASIRQAGEFFLKHFKPVCATRTCSAAASELIEAKRKSGKRESYLKGIGWSFGRFNKDHGDTNVSELAQTDIEEWLDEQEFGLATRRGYIRDFGILFGFCVDRGYCIGNPTSRIEKPTLEEEPPEIFAVDEAEALLRAASSTADGILIPLIAIGLFAGLRTSELKSLDWREIDLDERVIEVTGKKAKTRQRRLVKIASNLDAWLSPFRQSSGNVVPNRFREKLAAAVDGARGLLKAEGKKSLLEKWPKNGMRHSFASYHLALHQNAALTALELGHADTTMLFAHYRNLVKPKEADRYWKILPGK